MGASLAVHYLHTFGCVAYDKVVKPNVRKLNNHNVPMVFFGYQEVSKAYRLFDPSMGQLHVSCDVVFDENAVLNWQSLEHHRVSSLSSTSRLSPLTTLLQTCLLQLRHLLLLP